MIPSLVGHFDLISKKLGENCGFFNNRIFLKHVSISGVHTVVEFSLRDEKNELPKMILIDF